MPSELRTIFIAGSSHRAHVPEYFLALKRCLATLTHHLEPEMVEQVAQCCIHVLSTQVNIHTFPFKKFLALCLPSHMKKLAMNVASECLHFLLL